MRGVGLCGPIGTLLARLRGAPLGCAGRELERWPEGVRCGTRLDNLWGPYAETMQCWGLTIGSVLEPDHRGTRWDKRAGRTVDHVDDSELQGQAHAMPTRTDVHL